MLDNTAIYLSGKDMGVTNDNVEQKAEETIQLFGLPAEFYTFDTSFKGSKVEDGKLTLVLSYEYRDFDFLGLLDPIKVVQKSETVLWSLLFSQLFCSL